MLFSVILIEILNSKNMIFGSVIFFATQTKQNYFKWNHSNKGVQFYGRKCKTLNYRTHESQPDFHKAPISLLFPTENLAVFLMT